MPAQQTAKKTVPANVKQPEDHQAPAEETSAQPINVEHNGVQYAIDPGNANNLELFEFVEDEQYMKATRGFLGAEQWAKYKDSIRDEQGRVPADDFEAFLNKVMSAIGGERDDSPNS